MLLGYYIALDFPIEGQGATLARMIIRYAVKSHEQELLEGQKKGPVFVIEQLIADQLAALVGDWYLEVRIVDAEHGEFLTPQDPRVRVL